jgi:hypothetical protein
MVKLTTATVLLLAHMLSLNARAEDIGGVEVTAAERKACGSDVVRLCRDMMPDTMAVFGCMKEKRNKLSSACDRVARAHGL